MKTTQFIEGSRPEDLLFPTAPLDPSIKPSGHGVTQREEFKFLIRESVNGKRWSLFGIQDFETACRFADMFVLRFRKYLRSDSIRWNFSEQQAMADTADTSERGGSLANFFLDRAERELKDLVEPRTAHSKQERKANINRLDVLEACHANLEQKIVKLSHQIAALELHIDTLINRIERIEGAKTQ